MRFQLHLSYVVWLDNTVMQVVKQPLRKRETECSRNEQDAALFWSGQKLRYRRRQINSSFSMRGSDNLKSYAISVAAYSISSFLQYSAAQLCRCIISDDYLSSNR